MQDISVDARHPDLRRTHAHRQTIDQERAKRSLQVTIPTKRDARHAPVRVAVSQPAGTPLVARRVILGLEQAVDRRSVVVRLRRHEPQHAVREARVPRWAVVFKKLSGHVAHLPSECRFGIVQALLDRGQRQIEEGRDLTTGPLADVVQRHDLPLARRQGPDGLPDQPRELGVRQRIGRLRSVGDQSSLVRFQGLRRRRPSAKAIALFEHHGAQPTDEGLRVTQLTQVPKGGEKGLLCGVLRKVVVTEQGERVPDGHVLESHYEAAKRLLLAGLRAPDFCRKRCVAAPGEPHAAVPLPVKTLAWERPGRASIGYFGCRCSARQHSPAWTVGWPRR